MLPAAERSNEKVDVMMLRRKRRVGPAWWEKQSGQLVGLAVLTVVLAGVSLLQPTWVPMSAFSIILTLGGYYLRVRTLLVLYALVGAVVFFVTVNRIFPPTAGNYFVVFATGVLAMAFAISRRDLGLQGRAGDSMLLDLRDRLLAQSRIPTLPTGWDVEKFFSAADWQRFSGDFLVAVRTQPGQLELVLVDVSGKGPPAGSRSLSLSGAISGLMGSLPANEFLPAANRYLLRQDWIDGFATAVHVDLNLDTGEYTVRHAGHPPAAHYHLDDGVWEVLTDCGGPALGILDFDDYDSRSGVLQPGDALLLYTDGLVEEPGQDVSQGIDRLMRLAEEQLRDPRAGAARRIMRSVDAADDDDRSVVVIRRGTGDPATAEIAQVPYATD